MTDYISKTDLLLALAELPQNASKREVLGVIYDMPTTELGLKTAYRMVWAEEMMNLYRAWRDDRGSLT